MTRTPAKPKPSKVKQIKKAWKVSGKRTSLKEFARTDEEVREIAKDWFHNKTANFSKPPIGLGRTRKRKNQSGGKKN